MSFRELEGGRVGALSRTVANLLIRGRISRRWRQEMSDRVHAAGMPRHAVTAGRLPRPLHGLASAAASTVTTASRLEACRAHPQIITAHGRVWLPPAILLVTRPRKTEAFP